MVKWNIPRKVNDDWNLTGITIARHFLLYSWFLFYFILLFYFIFKFVMFIFEREREREAEREGDTEFEAGSRLWVSTERIAGLEPTNCDIMPWAEVRQLANWATQVPFIYLKTEVDSYLQNIASDKHLHNTKSYHPTWPSNFKCNSDLRLNFWYKVGLLIFHASVVFILWYWD